jgi:hypothetical protein
MPQIAFQSSDGKWSRDSGDTRLAASPNRDRREPDTRGEKRGCEEGCKRAVGQEEG